LHDVSGDARLGFALSFFIRASGSLDCLADVDLGRAVWIAARRISSRPSVAKPRSRRVLFNEVLRRHCCEREWKSVVHREGIDHLTMAPRQGPRPICAVNIFSLGLRIQRLRCERC